jgi:hypothetical protein
MLTTLEKEFGHAETQETTSLEGAKAEASNESETRKSSQQEVDPASSSENFFPTASAEFVTTGQERGTEDPPGRYRQTAGLRLE